MDKHLTLFVGVFCLFVISLPAHADGTHSRGVRTDGTVGALGSFDLPGPDYEIRAEYGHQAGANLFHSFDRFNIHAGETATFTGPDSIRNVISRVTGGEASWIDGRLASTIPNADVWFLNPAGLIFGPGASLYLPGSFHAGTGDCLRMGEEHRFHARPSESDVLSVSPPAAFGFLTDTPAPVIVQESRLSVSEGKTLSLIGGDLEMKGAPPVENENGDAEHLSGLLAESGEIRLVSAASSGEVPFDSGGATADVSVRGGNLTANHVRIDVGGERGGCVFVYGGNLEIMGSEIISETSGDEDGRVMEIHAENMSLKDGAEIASMTEGSGNSGDISLFVSDTLSISSEGNIKGHSLGTEPDAGSGGRIGIEAGQIILADGGSIASDTFGLGEAGSIGIEASDTLGISGRNERPDKTGIKTNTHSTLAGAGSGGRVEIEAGRIIVTDGGHIASDTFGAGDSGTVFLKAAHDIRISGGNIMSVSGTPDLGPEAQGRSSQPATGDAGLIDIGAGQIVLTDEAEISTSTKGPGQGGTIRILAQEMTLTENAHISSETYGQGEAGTITIRLSDALNVSGNNGKPDQTGIRTNTHSALDGAGNGGRVEIQADRIILADGGHIVSDTFGSGDSGSVFLEASHSLEVSGGKIMSMSGIPGGEGSGNNEEGADPQAGQEPGTETNPQNSRTPTGNAGHIEIRADRIVLGNDAEIATLTTGIGQGGTIHLIAEELSVSESRIGAHSQSEDPGAGRAGNIQVEADTLRLLNQGIVTAETQSAAGGNMVFEIPGLLCLSHGRISTSVRGGGDDGGNIAVHAPAFVVMNKGKIKANAYEGRGGNIRITAEQFIGSSDSAVEASSEKGIDGSINIESPDTDVGAGLILMPGTFIDASRWAVTPCSQRSGANMGRLEVRGRDGVAMPFGGFRPSSPVRSEKNGAKHRNP